jgi:hypothetical protein
MINALINSRIKCSVSIVERLLDSSVINRASLEDQTIDKFDAYSLMLLAVALRYSDRTNISSTIRYFKGNDVQPYVYLDISDYTPTKADIVDIYKVNANKLLEKCIGMNMVKGSDVFKELCERLNLNGIEIAIKGGLKPSYDAFDSIVYILTLTNKIIKDKILLNAATELACDIVKLLESHGYETDNLQRSKLARLIPKINTEIIAIEKVPQWARECKVPKGEPSHRLKALANDLGINKGSKEDICSTISEYAKRTLEEIIEEGQSAMAKKLGDKLGPNEPSEGLSQRDPFEKLFRILPSDDIAEASAKFSPVNNLCYNATRKKPYEYTSSGIIQHNEWCFVEDDFDNILRSKRNPYTGEILPNDILSKMSIRSSNPSYKATIKSVAKRIIGTGADTEEEYQRLIEGKFIALLGQYNLSYLNDMLRSISPEDMYKLSKIVLNVAGIYTYRAFINRLMSMPNKRPALARISELLN